MMLSCDRASRACPIYRDGERGRRYAALRAHLSACASCRAEAERLRAVEGALLQLPVVQPPAGLTSEVLRQVAGVPQPKEAWLLFSWETWMPVVAFAVALLIAMISMPPNLLSTMTLQDLEAMVRATPVGVSGWFSPLEQIPRADLFWVLWMSLFVTTTGVGLSLSLRNMGSAAKDLVSEWRGASQICQSHAAYGNAH